MKATRILLFLSPLLLFVPPLIHVSDTMGLAILDDVFKGMLGRFPWNAIMAYLCYTYARQLGREAWLWVVGSLLLPFLTPLILAFMPAKYGSIAEKERRGQAGVAPAKAAAGPFDSRFPLLSAYLAQQTPDVGMEARTRMDPVKANFEFSVFLEASAVDSFAATAVARQFAVWTRTEDGGVRVFGAGMIAPPALDNVTAWLRRSAPVKKVATAVHPAEGPTKFFEYYPSAD